MMGRPGTSTETVGFPAHSVLEDDELNPMAEGEAADSLHLKASLLLGQSSLSVECALPCVASVLPLPGPLWGSGSPWARPTGPGSEIASDMARQPLPLCYPRPVHSWEPMPAVSLPSDPPAHFPAIPDEPWHFRAHPQMGSAWREEEASPTSARE